MNTNEPSLLEGLVEELDAEYKSLFSVELSSGGVEMNYGEDSTTIHKDKLYECIMNVFEEHRFQDRFLELNPEEQKRVARQIVMEFTGKEHQ